MRIYRHCVLLFLPIVLAAAMVLHASNISDDNQSFNRDGEKSLPQEGGVMRGALPELATATAQVEDGIRWAMVIYETPREGRLGFYHVTGISTLTQKQVINVCIDASSQQEALQEAKKTLEEQNKEAVLQN